MPTLNEGQFSLDGYVFGTTADDVVVLKKGLDQSGVSFRSQDTPHPLGDATFFGRDQLTPPSWTFTLGARTDGDIDEVLEAFVTAWRADAVRSVPGARSSLTYCLNGRERVVYGRPRDFAVEQGEVADNEFKMIVAQFVLAETVSYGATERTASLSQITTTEGTGLVLPAVPPWALVATYATRAGLITMGSAVPASFIVDLYGPTVGTATDIKVWSSDWLLHFGVTLSPGAVFSYDTATGLATLNGAPVAANLKGGSTARPKVSPGSTEVVLTSSDTSNTVTGAIRWRDVFATF